jgi:adenosylcobinamide-GDP ribazoletransferase
VLARGEQPEAKPPSLGRRLIVAFQFLTRLPMPTLTDAEPADLSRSSVFFPLVGAVIGLVVAVVTLAGGLLNPFVAGLAGVIVWVAITGGLHLDGLGDVADGFGAAHGNPERFRVVLHDPHVGSFAVITIVLQIAAKLVLLGSVAASGDAFAVVLIPAWARWGAMVWGRTLPALWSGSGARFAGEIGWRAIGAWGLALALASAFVAPSLLAALVLVPAIAAFWRWRLGGISGDCLGASIEIMESLLLLALLATSA